MSHLFKEKYCEKYSIFPSFSPLVTFISSEQPLGDSLLWGKSILKNILIIIQMFSFFSFGDIYKFSATTWWVSGTQGTRAHIVQGRQKLGKVGKGKKILEVWQKIKMHERGNKMFNFQPKRRELQNLSSIEICLAVLWEYRDVLRTVEDETKTSLLLWRNTWNQSVSF